MSEGNGNGQHEGNGKHEGNGSGMESRLLQERMESLEKRRLEMRVAEERKKQAATEPVELGAALDRLKNTLPGPEVAVEPYSLPDLAAQVRRLHEAWLKRARRVREPNRLDRQAYKDLGEWLRLGHPFEKLLGLIEGPGDAHESPYQFAASARLTIDINEAKKRHREKCDKLQAFIAHLKAHPEKDPSGHRLHDALSRLAGEQSVQIFATLKECDASEPPKEEAGLAPWPEPIPLEQVPDVPEFPIHVLPAFMARFVREAGESLNCPPDYIAVPALAVAGAAIGKSRALLIKGRYRERANLYAVVVAPPGSTKSAALEFATAPLKAEQKKLRGVGDTKTLWTSDITRECMIRLLDESPRGILGVHDELSGWVRAWNMYRQGKGNDAEFWRSAHSGSDHAYHRAGTRIYLYKIFVAVTGVIPPDLLSDLRGQGDIRDGGIDRLLLTFPTPRRPMAEDYATVDEGTSEAWAGAIHTFLQWQGLPDMTPLDIRLSKPHGIDAWQQFTRRWADEVNADGFPEFLQGPWQKLKGACARLALILHCLDIHVNRKPADAEMDAETLERAECLYHYFCGHARKVYSVLDADRETEKAWRILAWLARSRITEFKRWEAFKDLKGNSYGHGLFPTPEVLDAGLDRLADHNWIRPKEPTRFAGAGRPPRDATYEVSPHCKDVEIPQNLPRIPRNATLAGCFNDE